MIRCSCERVWCWRVNTVDVDCGVVMWHARDVKWQSDRHRVSTQAWGTSPQPSRDLSVWSIHTHWHVNRAVFLRPNHDWWFSVRCGSGPWFLPRTLAVFIVWTGRPARVHTQRRTADSWAVGLSTSTGYRYLLTCQINNCSAHNIAFWKDFNLNKFRKPFMVVSICWRIDACFCSWRRTVTVGWNCDQEIKGL